MVLTRKRFSEEAILNILRQVELDLAAGSTVASAIRTAGISDATYYKWRKMYGGMGKSKLHEFKEIEKENIRLKRIVAELELDKLILKESLDYLNRHSPDSLLVRGNHTTVPPSRERDYFRGRLTT
jgi:transposase-like protein